MSYSCESCGRYIKSGGCGCYQKAITYDQLAKAIKVFNENGLSAEDIQKAWDNQYQKGFDNALEIFVSVLKNSEFLCSDEVDALLYEIEEEVENMKKES